MRVYVLSLVFFVVALLLPHPDRPSATGNVFANSETQPDQSRDDVRATVQARLKGSFLRIAPEWDLSFSVIGAEEPILQVTLPEHFREWAPLADTWWMRLPGIRLTNDGSEGNSFSVPLRELSKSLVGSRGSSDELMLRAWDREHLSTWMHVNRYLDDDRGPLPPGYGPVPLLMNRLDISEVDVVQLRSVARFALNRGFSLRVSVDRYVGSGVNIVMVMDVEDYNSNHECTFGMSTVLPWAGYWKWSGFASPTVPGIVVGAIPLVPLGDHEIVIFRRDRSEERAVYVGTFDVTVTTQPEISQPLVIDLRR